MNYEDLVHFIRKKQNIKFDSPLCSNDKCIYYLNSKKRSELIEVEWRVDLSGYMVIWKCPYCDYRSTTGNMIFDLGDIISKRNGIRRSKEIKRLLFNPQGVVP